MIISSNIAGSGLVPRCPPGTRLAAAIDVEWSKNYRVLAGDLGAAFGWRAHPVFTALVGEADAA